VRRLPLAWQPGQPESDTQTLKYVQCMQQHGVNAKTGSSGQGVGVPVAGQPGSSSEQQVQAAQQACRQYLPNGGMSPHRPSTQQMDRMAKLVQCLNQHGVPAQQSQGGPIQWPQGTDQSKVHQAMQACRQYTPAGGGGG
jgi:hypothetical protein